MDAWICHGNDLEDIFIFNYFNETHFSQGWLGKTNIFEYHKNNKSKENYLNPDLEG